VHIEVEQQFNQGSAQVQQSLAKIKQYQQSKQMAEQFEDGSADNITQMI